MADSHRQIMKVNRPLFVLVFVVALTFGCGRNPPATLESRQPPKTYTESDLTNLIIPGMSAVEVTNRFGTPNSTIQIDRDTVLLMYNFPLQPQNEALHLAGFDIYIKNGNVVKWSPMMEQSWQNYGPGSSPSSLVEQSFQVFLATGNLTNVANTIDAEGSADVSDIRAAPDLTFQAKVFSGSSGSESPGERTVILVVSDQDAGKLKDLTEQNFGKRLLIVCRNKVIAAPAISSPLDSKQLMFTVKNSVLNILKSR